MSPHLASGTGRTLVPRSLLLRALSLIADYIILLVVEWADASRGNTVTVGRRVVFCTGFLF